MQDYSAFLFGRSDKHQMKDPHVDRIKNATLLIFGFTFPGLGLLDDAKRKKLTLVLICVNDKTRRVRTIDLCIRLCVLFSLFCDVKEDLGMCLICWYSEISLFTTVFGLTSPMGMFDKKDVCPKLLMLYFCILKNYV